MATTARARILCIGNRFFAPDTAGPKIFDILSQRPLPDGVELLDGGLGGLNLLSCLEQTEMVIFVDAVAGFRQTPGLVVVNPLDTAFPNCGYDHDAGLAYLLKTAPYVLDGALPEMVLVGIEGEPIGHRCRRAADICLALVATERAVHTGDRHG